VSVLLDDVLQQHCSWGCKENFYFLFKKLFNAGTGMGRGYPTPLGTGRVTGKYLWIRYRDGEGKTCPHPTSLPCLFVYVETVNCLAMMKRLQVGNISSGSGLVQGDKLSSYIFIICDMWWDYFFPFNSRWYEGVILHCQGASIIIHLLSAATIIFFGEVRDPF